MPVVVLPRWAGALAAAAGLTVAGLAAVPASASSHARLVVPGRVRGAVGHPEVRPRLSRGPAAQRLPPGLPATDHARPDAVLHRGAFVGVHGGTG